MAHHSLRNHHKLHRLAENLRVTPAHAAGLLEFLWWSVYAESYVGPAGALPHSWTEAVIAHNAGWTGKTSAVFVKALITAGFLDRTANGNLSVHDLYDWAPDYLRRRWRRQGYTRTRSGEWLRDRSTNGHGRSTNGHARSYPDHDTRPDPTKRNDKQPVGAKPVPTTAGNPRQTRAGPEVMPEEFAGPDRAERARKDKFRNLFAAKMCHALGLEGLGARQQLKSLYAVARRIYDRGNRDELANRFLKIGIEKRDAGLEKPIAAWQKEVNQVLGKPT